MNREEAKDYASYLIAHHATEVEWLSIFEMYEDYTKVVGDDLSDADADQVRRLISIADVDISWFDDGDDV